MAATTMLTIAAEECQKRGDVAECFGKLIPEVT